MKLSFESFLDRFVIELFKMMTIFVLFHKMQRGVTTLTLFLLILICFDSSTSFFIRNYRTVRRCLFNSQELFPTLDQEEVAVPFTGPQGRFEFIERGFDLQELGISLMVGKSTVCDGRGLFLALANETVMESTIPKGTILCGYSKGEFKNYVEGDKTVGCFLSHPEAAVIFNKEIYSLLEVVESVASVNFTTLNPSKLDEKISKVLLGHLFSFNESKLSISLDLSDNQNSFFVPFAIEDTNDLSILNLGMFANDLAFSRDEKEMNEVSYKARSRESNILQLIWRLEWRDQRLVPTWPVVVFVKDVIIRNHEPIEVGLEYGWAYWLGKKESEGGPFSSSQRQSLFRNRKLFSKQSKQNNER